MVPISGDIIEPNLGLNAENKKMLCEKASVLIHSAASVRFTEPIHKAVDVNLMGTINMMSIASDFNSVHAFVHISAAYTNGMRKEIDEVIYPTRNSPGDVMSLLKDKPKDKALATTAK